MKSRATLLSLLFIFALSLPISALAQENQKQTPTPDNSQAQQPQNSQSQANASSGSQSAQSSGTQPTQNSGSEPSQASSTPATQNSDSQAAQTPSAQSTQNSGQAAPSAESSQQTQPSNTSDSSQERKYPHDGKEDDVSAIGNRKIGGIDWYSIEKEVAIGKQYAMQIEQSMRMVKDPIVEEYVNRIGQNLVRNSDAKVPFTIKVVDDDSVNAFALPGGFFYVNSGLILAADEEDELAGVMAHEIAHVAARHATRGATRAQLANLLSIPLIFVGGGIGYAAQEAAGIGMPLTFLKFSRGFEAEADYLGLQYMYKAGYDPNSFVAFFEKLEAQEKKKPGTLAKAFSTHPQTPDRIKKSQEEITKILPPRDQYIVTTSEFNDVKARLASIENRHRLDDMKTNKPTLRRTAGNTNGNGNGQDNGNGDDKPTLHRRDQ